MARGRSRRQRDASVIASRRLLRSVVEPLPSLLPLEDRRSFYPERVRPALGLFSWSADPVVADRKSDMSLPFRLAFREPKRVWICVRRKMRREALFALRRTGKGSRSRRRRRDFSDMRC